MDSESNVKTQKKPKIQDPKGKTKSVNNSKSVKNSTDNTMA